MHNHSAVSGLGHRGCRSCAMRVGVKVTVVTVTAFGADNYPFILFRIKIKYLRCLFVVDIPCNTSSHPDKKA